MNRAERRASGIKGKAPTYNLSAEAIQVIKEEEQKKSVDIAFILLLTIPTMVIRDKFGELMRKDAREEKFVNLVLKQYDLFMQGYFELDDLKECLLQETGISFDEIRRGRLYD